MNVGGPGALARLLRLPLLPTALADSFTGYLLHLPAGVPPSWGALGLLAAASAGIYHGGMVLNDLADLERDRTLHPGRPLPSGRVSPVVAALACASLLSVGGMAGGLAAGRNAWVPTGLIASVLLYDLLLKRWALPGALAMGACRGLNLLLGCAAARGTLPFEPGLWIPPLALGGYVAGVTLLSTREESWKGASTWVARLLRGIIPLDAAFLLAGGFWGRALAVLALLPAARLLHRRFPAHE